MIKIRNDDNEKMLQMRTIGYDNNDYNDENEDITQHMRMMRMIN